MSKVNFLNFCSYESYCSAFYALIFLLCGIAVVSLQNKQLNNHIELLAINRSALPKCFLINSKAFRIEMSPPNCIATVCVQLYIV